MYTRARLHFLIITPCYVVVILVCTNLLGVIKRPATGDIVNNQRKHRSMKTQVQFRRRGAFAAVPELHLQLILLVIIRKTHLGYMDARLRYNHDQFIDSINSFY